MPAFSLDEVAVWIKNSHNRHSTAKNKQSFRAVVARRALCTIFIFSFLVFLVLSASIGCFCPQREIFSPWTASPLLFASSDRTDSISPRRHLSLQRFICLLLYCSYHTSWTGAGLHWRSVNLPSSFPTFSTFCGHSQPLSACSAPHTEVTVRTLADSACLKRLFRSCILGDFGLGMRRERLFSVTPLAEVGGELEAGGGCLASWQHSLWKAPCTWL